VDLSGGTWRCNIEIGAKVVSIIWGLCLNSEENTMNPEQLDQQEGTSTYRASSSSNGAPCIKLGKAPWLDRNHLSIVVGVQG
jgi:hypothetical protein